MGRKKFAFVFIFLYFCVKKVLDFFSCCQLKKNRTFFSSHVQLISPICTHRQLDLKSTRTAKFRVQALSMIRRRSNFPNFVATVFWLNNFNTFRFFPPCVPYFFLWFGDDVDGGRPDQTLGTGWHLIKNVHVGNRDDVVDDDDDNDEFWEESSMLANSSSSFSGEAKPTILLLSDEDESSRSAVEEAGTTFRWSFIPNTPNTTTTAPIILHFVGVAWKINIWRIFYFFFFH